MEAENGQKTSEKRHPMQYKVRSGTTDSGKEYEKKMLTLFALRSVLQDEVNTWIASNAPNVGAFDDIILHHGDVTFLMQLKHKENTKPVVKETFKEEKGDFSLIKYYKDIISLKNSLNSKSDKPEFVRYLNAFDKLYFILFTNRDVNECDFLEKSNEQVLQLLNTSPMGKIRKTDLSKLSEIINLNRVNSCKDIYLFANQISVKHADHQIQKEINNIISKFNLAQTNVKDVADQFTKYITDWAEGRFGCYYCLSKTEILRKLSEILLGQYQLNLSKEMFDIGADTQIAIWEQLMDSSTFTVVNYNKSVVKFLVKYISREVFKYCKEDTSSWLCNLSETVKNKFYQNHVNLKSEMLKIVTNRGNITARDIYKCLWLTGKLPFLLIIENKQYYGDILQILKLCGYCYKVILINNSEEEIYPQKCDDPLKQLFSLEDLIETDRNDLLKLTVTLQGRSSVPLQHLVDQSFFHLIKCNDIINILLGNFNIGNDLEPLPDYFIERKVSKVLIKSEVLEKIMNEKFVIEGDYEKYFQTSKIQKCNVRKWADFDVSVLEQRTARNNPDFAQQPKPDVEKITHQTVHLLKVYDKHHFEWKTSYGSTKNIKQFVVKLEDSFENNILEKLASRLTLLSGPPGMGKSILMNYIARNAPPTKWVLKINLNSYIEYCRTHKVKILTMQHSEHLYNFFVIQNMPFTTLSHKVFEKLRFSKDVILLLDAFDEIPISYKEEITDMIKSLYNEGFHIYLTTRPHMESHLDEHFNTFSISLKPFSHEDQQQFLTKYFISQNKDINLNLRERYATEFTKRLLYATRKNLSDMDATFTEIPLQCALLAEVFNDNCREFILSKGTSILNESFDLLYLYRNFIISKMEILRHKFGSSSEDMLILLKNLQSLLALKLIFPLHKDIIAYVETLSKCHYTNESKEVVLLQKGGIITVDKNFNVSFAHRTFAEYLTAEWLAENFNNKDQNVKNYVKILMNERFTQNYNFLFIMFDRIVAENCPLHLNILNDKMCEANVNTDCNLLNDKCGRSPLHILALHCINYSSLGPKAWKSNAFNFDNIYDRLNKRILDILSSKIENRNRMIHNIIDNISICELDVFGYSPLDYALASCSLEVASKLYSKFERSRINASISFNQKRNYLEYCALHSCKKLFKILLIYFTTKELFLNMVNGSKSVQSYYDTVFADYNHKDKITNYITEFKGGTIKELVLSEGKKIFPRLENWHSDLHISTIFNSRKNVDGLIQNGVDINKKDNDYNTALHYAVLHKNIHIFNLLLKNKADVNAFNFEKNTPLHLSIADDNYYYSNQNKKIVTKLISKNTDINLQNSDGNTPLHLALLHKNERLAELLLSKNSDTNLENKKGHNALHLAAMQGFNKIVYKLLSVNVNIHKQNNSSDTPLHGRNCFHEASYHVQHTHIASEILPKINDINQQDNDGFTSLQLAVRENKLDVVKLLISSGANPNIQDKLGGNCLHIASDYGDIDIASQILPKINNINEQDKGGFTSLHCAVQKNKLDVIKLLISNCANPNIQDELGQNCLHSASYYGHIDIASEILPKINNINEQDKGGFTSLHYAVQENKLDIIKLLISNCANPNIQDELGQNCLHSASYYGHIDIASEILPKINNINQQDNGGFTSLQFAVQANKLDVVKLLISSGANPNIQDELGQNCLHAASYRGHIDIASEILPKINDINQHAYKGITSLQIAVQENKLDVVKLLISNGANPNIQNELSQNCLHTASYNGHTGIASEILPKINDINQQDYKGFTSLQIAVQENKLDVVKLLISSGANPNIQDELGQNCLHAASYRGNIDITSEILPKISNINQQTNKGVTSLQYAVQENKLDVVKLLISSGANPNIQNKVGLNCLHLASYHGHTGIASEILPKINDINQQDYKGFTSLQFAVHKNKLDVVKLLISSGANPNI